MISGFTKNQVRCLQRLASVIQIDITHRGWAKGSHNFLTILPDDFPTAVQSIVSCPRPQLAIVTGFAITRVSPPRPETDGPLGAIFLHRVCKQLQISCKIIVDEPTYGAMRTCEQWYPGLTADLIYFPTEITETATNDWQQTHLKDISHLIALERVGPSRQFPEHCFSMAARNITAFTAPLHRLFEAPTCHTIGIGDGGNEIGMGKLSGETIPDNIPNGETIACRIPTDELILCGISNWGAYALGTALAWLHQLPLDEILDENQELYHLDQMVANGEFVDGVTALATATVDGVSFSEYIRIFGALKTALEDENDARK
ncbi:MAG: DUF4392 domain-containing protein [Zavarzinella sp.]